MKGKSHFVTYYIPIILVNCFLFWIAFLNRDHRCTNSNLRKLTVSSRYFQSGRLTDTSSLDLHSFSTYIRDIQKTRKAEQLQRATSGSQVGSVVE